MARRKIAPLQQSLTDSWGVVDHEYSDADSSDQAPSSVSEYEDQALPTRASEPTPIPLEDDEATPRPSRSLKQAAPYARTTSPRTRSMRSQEPQFIMPTPDSTPVRNLRRRPANSKTQASMASSMSTKRSTERSHGSLRKDSRSDAPRERGSKRWQEHGGVLWDNVINPAIIYLSGCLIDAAALLFSLLKIPLTVLLAILAVKYLLRAAMPDWLSLTLPQVPLLGNLDISPCSIPLASSLIPGCGRELTPLEKAPSYDRMTSLQESWDRMLEIAQQSAPIPMQMSVAQAAIADTRNLIKHQSQLPSKAQLLMEIQMYMDLSKQATYEFTDFGSHVGRTVDKVISMNRLTLSSLEMFKNKIESRGIIGRTLDALLPYGYLHITEADLIDQYLKHASEIEDQTDALITEGEQVAMRLQEMENTLEEIRGSANRDLAGFIERKEELFAKLWTKLGGNSKDKRFVEKNIRIADRLSSSANEAALTVRQWLLELRSVKNDIADLRARVNEPRSRAYMSALEIEEHIKYVQDGLDRLYSKRIEGRERKEQGMQGIKQYVQGYWKSRDTVDQVAQKKIDNTG